MSGRKGRAMSRGVAQGARAYMGLLVIQAVVFAVSGVRVPFLADVTEALVIMTALSLGVLAAWNAWSWLEDGREKREARRAMELLDAYPGPARYDVPLVIGADVHGKPVYYSLRGAGASAVQRAVDSGTLSLNGYRYMGPPPVVHTTRVTYEVREGVRLIREMRVTEERMLPSGRDSRVSKSECDECGAPLDTARCEPGWYYTCPRCRASQVFRPY